VEGRRAGVDEVLDELGDRRPGGPVGREGGALLGGRDLTGQEEPEEGLGQGLVASGSLGEELLALGDGLAAEADALVCERSMKCQRDAPQINNRTSADLPASRTEPSQIMPLMPRMPLRIDRGKGSGIASARERSGRQSARPCFQAHDRRGDAPVSLVDGVLAERLVAVLLADGLDLQYRRVRISDGWPGSGARASAKRRARERTFSISLGMSSARVSLSVLALAA
jgi:hypothetical protein